MTSGPTFDLDKAIASWRRTMTYNRAFTADDLDELEQHVRDQVAALRGQGLAEKEAFRRTMREMGSYNEAEAEYRKVYWGKLRRRGQRIDELIWRLAMLKNYLKITVRQLKRQPLYTTINVLGLAVGMACCLLIGLYVQDELSYDRFHEKANRIYKVQLRADFSNYQIMTDPPATMAAKLLETVSDVEGAVRVHVPGRVVVNTKQDPVYEEGLLFTEPTFFDLFDFPLLRGDPASALARPGTMLITPALAHKHFGESDPVGQTLNLYVPSDAYSNEGQEWSFEVTGVLHPPPPNSSFQFQMLASLATLATPATGAGKTATPSFETYLLVQDHASLPDLKTAVNPLLEDLPYASMAKLEAQFEPLTSLHMRGTSTQRTTQFSGNRRYVSLFSVVALLILLVGCVNFTSLATARSLRRAREVGIRKVVGAQHGQLIRQFLGEALLLTFLAGLIAVVLVELALPLFNDLVTKQLDASYFGRNTLLPWLAVLLLVVSGLAGSYPAFVLSRFRPTAIFKGSGPSGTSGARLRQALVVFQFTISIALIVAVLVVRAQLDYIQTKNLGLNPDQIVALKPQMGSTYEAFKQELLKLPGVTHVTFASLPGGIGMQATPEGSEEPRVLSTQLVDPDFIEALGLRLVAGQDFAALPPSEASRVVLINETAAKELGWTDPLGKTLTLHADTPHRVTGVVADFHSYSLRQEIRPSMILLGADPQFQSVLVRLRAEDMPKTLQDLRGIWVQFVPEHPFEYTFLDEQFAELYRTEQRLGQLFGVFSLLAVLIACLGLFGLATYVAEQRTKEVGIRKVLGASVPSIVALLSKNFLTLVALAFILALPVAYFAMQRWLDDFAYRVDISWRIFLMAGLAALGVALATVSYQAIKAALADPVKSLRYE